MRHYFEWVVRHRLMVLIATTAVTAFFTFHAKNLHVQIDTNALLPPSHPYVIATNKIEAIFGSRYIIVVGLTPAHGDVFQPLVLEKVKRMTDAFAAAPSVVRSKLLSFAARRAKDIAADEEGLTVRRLLPEPPYTEAKIAELKAALARNPVYESTVVSLDARTAAIVVEFKEDPAGFQHMVGTIAPIIERERDADVRVEMTGLPVFLAKLEGFSQRMGFLFPLAIVLVGLIHMEAFRTRQGLILPLVTALLAVGWGVGIMAMCGISMDVFNAATPILILAVAAGHAVQLLKRYYEEYARWRTQSALAPLEASRRAIVDSLVSAGPVTAAAGLIAALGFFSLGFFEISSIRTFGIFTGVGILSAVTIEMTFMPALRATLRAPPDHIIGGTRELKLWGRISETAVRWVTQKRRGIYAVTIAFALASIAATFAVTMNDSTKSFFSSRLDFYRQDDELNARLAGTNSFYVLVEGAHDNDITDPNVLVAMDSVQRFLEQQPGVGKTISLVDFIKRMNQAMHGDEPRFYRVPEDRNLIAQYLLLYTTSGDPGDFDPYVDYAYRSANITTFVKTDSSAYIEQLIPQVKHYIDGRFPENVRVSFGGSIAQTAALSDVMIRTKVLNIVQIGAVVFLVSAFLLQSVVGALLVLAPLAFTVLINFGLLGATRIPLNIPTALCSTMAVGIGADYSIYLIFRLREELRHRTLDDAVRYVMRTAGKATLFVASAIAAGYGVLAFSYGFHIHQWMALLIANAMIVSALSTLLVVPALVLSLQPKFLWRRTLRPIAAPASALVLFFVAALWCARAPLASDLDAREIMQRNFVASRVVDSQFDATIMLINKSGQQRVRKTIGMTKLEANGFDNMRVTRFTAPPDIDGTVSLLIEHADRDDDIWIYLPALKKVRRLVASNKKDSFVGTDLSYGDVIGHKVDDWKHTSLKDESINGEPCYVIESTPISDRVREDSGYAKRLTWVSRQSFATLRAEFLDTAGQPLKTTNFTELRQVDGEHQRWQSMHFEAVNVQSGHHTVFELSNFKANQHLGDAFFTTQYMARGN